MEPSGLILKHLQQMKVVKVSYQSTSMYWIESASSKARYALVNPSLLVSKGSVKEVAPPERFSKDRIHCCKSFSIFNQILTPGANASLVQWSFEDRVRYTQL